MKRKRFYGWWLMLLCASLLSVTVWGAFPALGMAAGAAEEMDSKGMDLKEMDSRRSDFKEAVSEEAELKEAELEVAGVESQVVMTDVYTDSHGVTYSWRGYGDGTAEIYEFSFGEGDVVMEIPGSLEGYTVTRLTGVVGKREIVSVTIPESITVFGQATFRESAIGTVYYNAVDAVALDSLYFSPFGYTEIGDFVVGDRVEKFAGYLFYETVFLQEEFSLEVPWVAGNAFYRASFHRLDITDQVGKLDYGAFMDCEVEYLYFDSPDVEVGVSPTSGGPFYSTEILGLEFGGGMTEIPDYLFAYSEIRVKEVVFTQERIGKYAFASAWETPVIGDGEGMADRITLTGDVKTLGVRAFGRCCMDGLVIEGNLEDEAEETMESPFYEATVCQLSFGEGVDSLPDFLFSEAYFQMPEMTVSIPRIGAACFQGVWDTKSDNCSPVELTITEDVEYIGLSAFAYNRISRLDYGTNAVNGATSTTNGVFQSAEIGELVIGEQVEVIRPFLFANVKFVEDIDLELDIPVGDYAFFSSQKSFHGFGNVKLGENVSYVGKGAFHYRDMDTLFYHAVSAAVELKSTNDAPFFGCVLGELQFGDKVEVLGKSLFCGVELKQEELVFPDSVREIGNYFFYDYPYLNDGIQVGTLRIGSGLKMLTDHTFHGIGFDSIYVEAWEAGEDYRALADGVSAGYLPVCGDLYIHRGSDFYHYFAANAVEKHLYCEDFMVSSVGEERFDEGTHKFVTPLYETCSVCGYRLESEKVEDACAVTFLAMGDVVDVRYCKAGGDVEPPDAPEISGYVFQGWDHSCEGIWADMEVSAVYAEREYQVTVYAVYADGRESGHTVYRAKKGEVITLPVYEPGLEKVVLEGYEGVRVHAPDFVWSIGEHDGTYRVSGDAEIVAREGNFYVVQFVDEAGKVVDTQRVHSGYDAVPPVIEDATVSGSDGVMTKCWEKGYYNVDSDRVVRMESSKEYFSYGVSFVDENGNVIKTVTVVHGAAVEDIPEAPEKVSDGCFAYLFREWVCEGASTVDCVVGDAVFRPAYSASAIIYRVSFESNGGGDVESVEVEGGKCLAEPDTPVREGYGFAGWYVDRELSEKYDFGAGVMSDLTLYAGWQETESGSETGKDPGKPEEPGKPMKHTVVFVSNGGSAVAPVEVEDGGRLAEPDKPVREGFEFVGWYLEEGLLEKYDFGAGVKSDLTLYAGWKEIEGGSETGKDPGKPEEPGKAVKHTVVFVSNGGSAVAPVEVEDGGRLAEPDKPVREGFEFVGWYLEEGLTEKYDFGAGVKSDLTLYAGWKETEGGSEPGQEGESTPEPTPDLGQEPEPTPEPTPDLGQEPESTSEPEQEPELEAMTGTGKEPGSTPKPTPGAGQEAEPEPEPVPEMRPDEESVPESDGVPVPESESLPEFVLDQSTISRQGMEGSPVELSKEGRGMDRLLPVAAAVAVGTGGSGGFCFFWFFRRRRVAGIVMDVDGNGMEGICVLLDDRKIVTNQRGEFRFHGMRRGNHKFCVFDSREKAVLVMDLFTDAAEDREIFTVLEDDTVRTDAHREGKRYFVDVVMAKGI